MCCFHGLFSLVGLFYWIPGNKHPEREKWKMGCSSVDRERPKQTSGHGSSPANILGMLVHAWKEWRGRGGEAGRVKGFLKRGLLLSHLFIPMELHIYYFLEWGAAVKLSELELPWVLYNEASERLYFENSCVDFVEPFFNHPLNFFLKNNFFHFLLK